MGMAQDLRRIRGKGNLRARDLVGGRNDDTPSPDNEVFSVRGRRVDWGGDAGLDMHWVGGECGSTSRTEKSRG